MENPKAKFEKQKTKEHNFFTHIFFKNKNIPYNFTEDEFCSWDAESPGFNYELKIRKFGYKYFSEDFGNRPMIEKFKYDALMMQHELTGQVPILVFAFTDILTEEINAFKMWNLLSYPKDKLVTQSVKCNKSEYIPEEGTEYKPCYFMDEFNFKPKAIKLIQLTIPDVPASEKIQYISNQPTLKTTQGEDDWNNLQEYWNTK